MPGEELKEFEVRTACKRRFAWSAYDADGAKRHAEHRGYVVISVMPLKER